MESQPDHGFIPLAIDAARKSQSEDGRIHPRVGAVVVKNGAVLTVVHRGMTIPGAHADYIALNAVPNTGLVGATLFVTLEPCTARIAPTLPCAQLITARRLARVVVGMLDPNPAITGRRILHLRSAGISVQLFRPGPMREVEELNSSFAAQHGWIGRAI